MPRAAVLLLALPALAAPAVAIAQDEDLDGPVVATAGPHELRVQERGRQVCVTLDRTGTCGRPPRSPFQTSALVSREGGRALGGAVPPQVLSAEVEAPDGTRAAVATVAVAGVEDARFYLAEAPAGVVLVRFLDADGRLVGAEEPERAGPRGGDRRPLLAGDGLEVQATVARRFSPTPRAFDRLVPRTCVEGRVRRAEGPGVCLEPADDPALSVTSMPGCAGLDGLVYGLADGAATHVRVTLGTGRRLVRATQGLPTASGPRRAVALRVPGGVAVRDAVALDAGGRVLRREVLGQPPGDRRCSSDPSGVVLGTVPRPGRPAAPAVAAEAGGRRLLVADDTAPGFEDRLCGGIDRVRADSCGVPPVAARDLGFLMRRGRTVAGVLPRDVAQVELRLDRGAPLAVATTGGDGYRGRYAGTVRFLAAELPRGRAVRTAVLRDAAGHVLARTRTAARLRRADARTILRGRGFSLVFRRVLGGVDLPGWNRRGSGCVSVAVPGRDGDLGCAFSDGDVQAVAPCRPRAVVVLGRLGPGLAGATVVLADGRRIAARVARPAGRFAPRGVWAVRVPRHARVVAVVTDRRRAFDVPPAARQCGYGRADPSGL